MLYKITKFPEQIILGSTLTDIKSVNGKHQLTFYKDFINNKKFKINFFGEIHMPTSCLNEKVYSVVLNSRVGFALQDKLLKFTQIKNGVEINPIQFQDLDDYQEIIFFFDDKEFKIAGKNITIEEIEDDNIIFRTRKQVMPSDLNGAGTLFGGRAASFLDEEAYIYCVCQLDYKKLVTINMSGIDYVSPAHNGDIIEIGCKVVRFGTTSITVKGAIRNKTTKKLICQVEEITFVALDENGKPMPHGKTNETKD